MSGGHWDYLAAQLRSDAEETEEWERRVSACLRFLAAAEQELDWGHSADTCLACARRRVLAGLDLFFDRYARDAAPAEAVLRDREQVRNYCDRCLRDLPTWGRPAGQRPTLAEAEHELRRRLDEAYPYV